MSIFCYTIDHSKGFSICGRVIRFRLREFPACVIHRPVPPWFDELHEHTPDCYVGRVNEHMKIFCLFRRLHNWGMPWNGIRCTTICNGVVKLAKYQSIQLCHQICPKNRLNALVSARAKASNMAFTLFGSTTTPSLLNMWTSNIPLITPNTHLLGLRLGWEPQHFSRHIWRWSRYSPFWL